MMSRLFRVDQLMSRLVLAFVVSMMFLVTALPANANGRLVGNVYVMENNPTGNRIVVLGRFSNGSLKQFGSVATGGLGAGDNSEVDPLGSQDSLIISENRRNLYAVNAGDNTVSIFHLNRKGIPRLVQKVSSNGEFPVSLTSDGDSIYVLNSGGDGTIAGYKRGSKGRLSLIDDSIRTLGVGGSGRPFGDARNFAPGDISFDTLNRRLVITFAGGGNGGQLLSFAVNDQGTPANTATVIDSEGAVPFSLDFTENGTAIVAEASGSLSSYDFSGDSLLQPVSSSIENNQALACWVRVTKSGHVYSSNTGAGTISLYQVSRNGELSLQNATAAENLDLPIDFDLTRNERFLYVVSTNEGGVRGYRVNPRSGELSDIGLFGHLPTFANDGFVPQGLAIR